MSEPLRLQYLSGLVDGEKVLAQHSADAVYSADESGRWWVRKREFDTGFQPLLAEGLSWLLARTVGLTVPDAAVIGGDETERSWLSLQIEPVLHWSEAQIPCIENLSELGRLLAINVFILNEDCHAGNVLLHATGDGFKIVAIDFGNALVGHIDDFITRQADQASPENLIHGIPVELIEEQAHDTGRVLQRLDAGILRSFVDDACTLVNEPRSPDLFDALRARQPLVPKLIVSYLESIREREKL